MTRFSFNFFFLTLRLTGIGALASRQFNSYHSYCMGAQFQLGPGAL